MAVIVSSFFVSCPNITTICSSNSSCTLSFLNFFSLKKSRALLLLRKKKCQEGLLTRTDGQMENLERLVNDLEFAQVERQVRRQGTRDQSFSARARAVMMQEGGKRSPRTHSARIVVIVMQNDL